jgi:hypothetical protein
MNLEHTDEDEELESVVSRAEEPWWLTFHKQRHQLWDNSTNFIWDEIWLFHPRHDQELGEIYG